MHHRAKRLILGLGPGRCGTVSLAHLLAYQNNCAATHENKPWLPWKEDYEAMKKNLYSVLARPAYYVADVGMYWLKYLSTVFAMHPECKAICLVRPVEDIAASFVRKTNNNPKRNHWTDAEWDKTRECPLNQWDKVFPTYPDIPPERKYDACLRYAKEYYEIMQQISEKHSRKIMYVKTSAMFSDPETQLPVLKWAGFAQPVIVTGIHKNTTVKP